MIDWRSASKAEFEAWHEQYKRDNGYPLQGRNAATGELVDIGWTTEYTAPIEVDATDVRFVVDSKVSTSKPGRASLAPVRKADGSVNIAASKADQVALAEPVAELRELK